MPGRTDTGVFPLPVTLLLVAAAAVTASELASTSTGAISFGIDTALFDYAGSDTLGLEVYQQVDLGQLSRDIDSTASFSTTVILIDTWGDTVAVNQWNSEVRWTPDRSVVNSTVLPAPPGDYTLFVVVTDLGNGRQGTVQRDVVAAPASGISEIELARAVVPAPEGSGSMLRKGNVLVYPAAGGRFSLPEEHMAYFYVELYDAGGSELSVQSRLETASGEVIFARPWHPLGIPEGVDAAGLVDSLDLRVIRSSGLHELVFQVVQGGDTLSAVKPLMVVRSPQQAEMVQETGALQEIPYPDHFRLILSGDNRDLWENLEEEGRLSFYLSYWESEAQREAFEQRCEESLRYATSMQESWETDRGRVYVLYGPPDDVEISTFQDRMPHEIWYYHAAGNETFVFGDIYGIGDFMQIYSTVEGEVSYSNWEDMLSPIDGGGGFNR